MKRLREIKNQYQKVSYKLSRVISKKAIESSAKQLQELKAKFVQESVFADYPLRIDFKKLNIKAPEGVNIKKGSKFLLEKNYGTHFLISFDYSENGRKKQRVKAMVPLLEDFSEYDNLSRLIDMEVTK